jgi:single-strand DNA-binding protein
MVNEVILIGNLGDEVKLHYFESGDCIGRFPLATSKSWTKKDTGEKQTETSWHNIVVRNKIAENCEKYLSKGSKVFVKGSISYRKFQGDDGKDVYTTEIRAVTVQFLDPAKGSSNVEQPRTEITGNGKKNSKPENAGNDFLNSDNKSPRPFDEEEEDDDLPF